MKIYTVFERDGNDEPIYKRFFTSKGLRDRYINWLISVGVPKKAIHKAYIKTDTAKPKKYCMFFATKNYNNNNEIEVHPWPYYSSGYYRKKLNAVENWYLENFTLTGHSKYTAKKVFILATNLQKAKEKAEMLFT